MRRTNDKEILEMLDAGRSQLEIARHFGVSPPAISKRLRKLRPPPLPEALLALSLKERKFCLARAEGKTATQAALASFECGSMDSAKNIGSQLSKRPDIEEAVSVLLQDEGLGRRRRAQILSYHAENLHDSAASLKAVDLANKMENLYVQKEITMTVDYADLKKSYEEVRRQQRELEQELGIDPDGVEE